MSEVLQPAEQSAQAYTFEETVSQPYLDCKFSAGLLSGHPVDTLYLRLEREGEGALSILLRPDEAAALAYCLSGVLWSHEMGVLTKEIDGA